MSRRDGRLAEVVLAGVGVLAPGLEDWNTAKRVLSGREEFRHAECADAQIEGISPRERRRLTGLIRQALQVAQDALSQTTFKADEVATVFVSADGDLHISDKILSALTLPGKPVSPTHFHQSVHNAPAGYWHNIHHSLQPSTTLSGAEETCAVGLMESVSQVLCQRAPVLLVIYDEYPPEVFRPFRPMTQPFAVALLLAPADHGGKVFLQLNWGNPSAELSRMPEKELEQLRISNPAARILPLLRAVARGADGQIQVGERCAIGLRVEPGQ